MAKTTGLGDNYIVGGYDLSGDTNSLQRIGGGHGVWDSTGIDKSAIERLALLRDGSIEWNTYFNTADDKAHEALSALPTTDTIATYCRGTTAGNPAACVVAKQVNYDWTRNADGGLMGSVQALANGYGLQWGQQLTGALDTVTVTGAGAGVDFTDTTASAGAQAFLQVTDFTGTNISVKIQDSDDNNTFADVTGLAFTAVTAAHSFERKATTNTTDIGRYLRYTVTGSFTSATIIVVAVRNSYLGQVF